jgi:hypothetical protein
MPSAWLDVFSISMLAWSWALALAPTGGPLLWKFLSHRPVTQRALVSAAWNFLAMGTWITVGNGLVAGRERGMISGVGCSALILALFVILAGVAHVLERRYPGQPEQPRP